ncbi:MAG: PemK family transcriptional regulator, partial [Anaerolineae bacterium UTCFX1]|jgi:mRNA interferase MazF
MKIIQGDVFWIPVNESNKIESDYTHPHVVIENNAFTVVICAMTSNLKRAKAPGNVLLEEGEANLPKQSVIEVAKVFTIDKTKLGEYIGTLTEQRINQVLAGISFLQAMTHRHK